jgi:DNA polymerase III delta prime subunit
MDEAVTTYYNQLLDEGMSPNDIAKQMYKEDNQLSETMALYKKKTPTK